MGLKFEITGVDVALVAGVCVFIGSVESYIRWEQREAETTLMHTRSMVACVKDHGRDSCNGALRNLLGRETNIGACRDAQRAVEALTSYSPGRLDDAVKACRG